MPATKTALLAVYQRCPAAPDPAPFGAYVYQAKNKMLETGLTSIVNPCPLVAASYQFPERAKSAFVGRMLVSEQVSFWVRRVSGIIPERPEPSVNA